jgi:hypothetical protein
MGGYFSEVLMVSKFVLSLVPRPFTAVMIAIAIPAAMLSKASSPYPGTCREQSEGALTADFQPFRVAPHKICSNVNESPPPRSRRPAFLQVVQ